MAGSQPEPSSDPREWEVVAEVTGDRLCGGCGYNLRTQPVRREPGTRLPVVHCPECGRFESGDGPFAWLMPWIQRAATLLAIGWVLLLAWLAVMWGVITCMLNVATVDELTTLALPGGRAPRPGPGDRAFVGFMDAVSAALGFVAITVLVVALPHWRRWGQVLVGLLIPLAGGLVALLMVLADWPVAAELGRRVIGLNVGMQWAGVVLAVLLGRRPARLAALVLLPPAWRGAVAYLWRADGLEPPGRG